MSTSPIMTGARAIVGIYDPNTGTTRTVGIFNSVSLSAGLAAEPAYILGSHLPQEITYTASEVVSITASGWRIVGHGWHNDGHMPKVQDLLNHQYLEMTVIDRQTQGNGGDGRIVKVTGVRPVGAQVSYAARGQSEITLNFMGLAVGDESGDNTERADAATLPL